MQVGGLLPGGLTVRGISGGEKRRLSIACGCVGAPKIIALDEPTSGLDANAALVVMQCMARLAGQQRIVISSIHQPRASIWDLFTKVQVLSEGRMLYFGPTDQVCTLPPGATSRHILHVRLPSVCHAAQGSTVNTKWRSSCTSSP